MFSLDELKPCAKRSRENYIKAIERIEERRSDLKLYLVVHGDTDEKWKYWWSCIKDLPCEGYGTGLKPTTNAVLQMACLARLHSSGFRGGVHLLGVSGTSVIAALAWASRCFKRVTFDSLSYGQGSISKAFMYFRRFKRRLVGFGKAYDIHPISNPWPAESPITELVEDPERLRDWNGRKVWGNDTAAGLLIALHNLWWYNEYTRQCEELALKSESAYDMIEELKYTGSEEAIAGINFWEDYQKRGLDEAQYIWRERLTSRSERDTTSQMEMF
jgi:hypothetical protein